MKDDTNSTKQGSYESSDNGKPWRFVTNHTQVLLTIARNPDSRTRDIAEAVGITERAAQRIVADLVEAGFLKSVRVGRRNPLHHPSRRRDATSRPGKPADRRPPRPPRARSDPFGREMS
jgi:predicted HTH transcriptional regulator